MPSLDNARWVQAVFDNPYCFFGPEFMDYPRRELLDNVAGRDNIQLLVSRQIGTENWRHAFVADGLLMIALSPISQAKQIRCFRSGASVTKVSGMKISPLRSASSSTPVMNTRTPLKKYSATFTPFCTRRHTANVTRSICALTSRGCLFRKRLMILKR